MGALATIKDVAHKTGVAIDDIACAVAPRWGARRKASRRIQARFDGASRKRRLELWKGMQRGANAELDYAARTLRERARDLRGNHWAASRAIEVIKNHVIGGGIVPTPRGDNVADVSALLRDVTAPTYTGFDVEGTKSLFALYAMALGAAVGDGDGFMVAHFRSSAQMREFGLALPLQIRTLEADHLDTLKTRRLENGGKIIRGIEFDRSGRRVAYWLFEDHPRESLVPHRLESKRVPAELVVHLFDEWRPGQVSGLPWFAPVMVKMRDVADYEDAHLVRQKIAALFAAFIHQPEELPSIGMEDATLDEDGEQIWAPTTMEPGTLEYLRPGEDITFAAPPGVEGLRDFSEISARQIAAGCDLTYEALTTDYSNVNFTSARMGWLEMAKSVERWQKTIVMPKLCSKVEFWLRMAIAASTDVDPGQRRWKHTPPRPEMIDPVRETSAMLARVRGGFSSRKEEVARRGGNVDEVDREIAEDNQRAESLGIVLDSNPAQTTAAGLTPTRVTEEMRQDEDGDGDGDEQNIQSRLRRARDYASAAIQELRGIA